MSFFIVLLLHFFVAQEARAQITDTSFFPMMVSINPGVVHMRRGGILAVDMEKNQNKKKHDVPVGGIVGGIETNVDVDAGNFFFAGTAKVVSTEILVKKEKGIKEEKSFSTTDGSRKVTNDAESDYFGGILDFRYFGVSYASASYDYLNMYRLGAVPSLEAYDEKQTLDYKRFKIGSAIKIGFLRLGGYYVKQNASGNFNYTEFDETTGTPDATVKYPVKVDSTGMGLGLGLTTKRFRSEFSCERMMAGKIKIANDYPLEVKGPGQSQRLTGIAEAKVFSFLSLGVRLRMIKGNYVDLEDIISSNLLYNNLEEEDTRNEITYNFSFGDSMGFSPSFFFMQSMISSKEKSPIYDDGKEYKAKTMSTSFGATLSFRF